MPALNGTKNISARVSEANPSLLALTINVGTVVGKTKKTDNDIVAQGTWASLDGVKGIPKGYDYKLQIILIRVKKTGQKVSAADDAEDIEDAPPARATNSTKTATKTNGAARPAAARPAAAAARQAAKPAQVTRTTRR